MVVLWYGVRSVIWKLNLTSCFFHSSHLHGRISGEITSITAYVKDKCNTHFPTAHTRKWGHLLKPCAQGYHLVKKLRVTTIAETVPLTLKMNLNLQTKPNKMVKYPQQGYRVTDVISSARPKENAYQIWPLYLVKIRSFKEGWSLQTASPNMLSIIWSGRSKNIAQQQ